MEQRHFSTEETLDKLRDDIIAIDKKLDKAISYLYDDDSTNTPGIVQRVRSHEKRLDAIDEDKRVRNRLVAVLGMVGGVIGMVLVEIVKSALTKYLH